MGVEELLGIGSCKQFHQVRICHFRISAEKLQNSCLTNPLLPVETLWICVILKYVVSQQWGEPSTVCNASECL